MMDRDALADIIGTHIIWETGWSDGTVLCGCGEYVPNHSEHVADVILEELT